MTSLMLVKNYFDCGKIFINRRKDNHRENLYRYCVRLIQDLNNKIVPFFTRNELKTAKKDDFEIFSQIVKKLSNQDHSRLEGIAEIAKMTEKMNRKRSSKFLESSETIRRSRR